MPQHFLKYFYSVEVSVFVKVLPLRHEYYLPNINLYKPVERYITRRIGVVMYRQVRFCYCPVEGGVGIEQYRNGLGLLQMASENIEF